MRLIEYNKGEEVTGMTLIKLEDMIDTLKRVGEEQKNPDMFMLIGFISGMVEKTPKYIVPDELIEQFKR